MRLMFDSERQVRLFAEASMRTAEEIRFEIHGLQGLSPAPGPNQRQVNDSLLAAIEELEHGVDDTTEEFENEPDIVKDSVHTARRWKNGESSDRPSKGYEALVK